MQVKQTHYELLDVPADAAPEQIERAYRRARSTMQRETAAPDRRAEMLLQNAYETLSDPFRRAAYDEERRSPKGLLERVQRRVRSRNATIAAGLAVVAAGAFVVLRPDEAPAPRGKGAQEIVAAASLAVGRLSTIDLAGNASAAGVAFAIAPGRLAASCRGIAPDAQLVVDFAKRRMPARVARLDPQAGLCMLAAEGLGSWPLEFGTGAPRPGETVYLARPNAAGEAELSAGRVKRVVNDAAGEVIEANVKVTPDLVGAPLLDYRGRVVAVADTSGRHHAIPDAWIEEARGPRPEPHKPQPEPEPDAQAQAQGQAPAPGALEPTVQSRSKLIQELSKARAVPKDL